MSDPIRFPGPPPLDEDIPSGRSSESRSFRVLVMEVVRNIQDLIRSEFRLATTELSEEIGRLGKGAALAGGGAIALLLAGVLVLWAAVYALALVVPLWASALIIGAVIGAVGGLLVLRGLKQIRLARALKPVKTIDSIKETAQWAKDRMK